MYTREKENAMERWRLENKSNLKDCRYTLFFNAFGWGRGAVSRMEVMTSAQATDPLL